MGWAAIGRDAMENVLGPRLNRVRRGVVQRGVLAVAAIRLVPIAPFTLVNLVAGASKIPFADYLLGTIIGMAPGLILMSALGYQIWSIITEPTPDQHFAFRPGGARLARRLDWRAGGASALAETRHIEPAKAGIVRVMTWNIHGGVGTDGRFDLGAGGGYHFTRIIPMSSRCRRSISRRIARTRRARRSPCCAKPSAITGSKRSRSATADGEMARWW